MIKSSFKNFVSIIMVILMVMGLGFAGLGQHVYKAYAAASSLKAGDTGVLISNTNLRTTGGMDGKIILTVKKGTSVKIIKAYNYWYKVSLPSGRTGFMIKRNITAIPKVVQVNNTATSKNTTTETKRWKAEKTMVLATTTSTRDTGLLDYLVPIFEKKYNTSVKVISVGTGEAIEMGKRGDADVLLVHARAQEDAFVNSGYGVNRKDVMHNEFFIVGPKDDPAKISSEKDVVSAMKKIADSKSTFISRGDKSGTNTKELSYWAKANIKPQGESWYKESGQGMGDTLMMAAEMGGYTLTDSGTWYAYMDKVNLKVVLKGAKDLLNPYGVIAVNPEKYKNIHYNAAMAFIDFITSEEGQKLIAGYKQNGHQLFYPDAKK